MRHVPRLVGVLALASMVTLSTTATAQQAGPGNWAQTPMIERQLPVSYTVHSRDPASPIYGFTVIAPTGLSKSQALPVMLWENGSCTWNNTAYQTFLERIAASGVVIIAKGAEGVSGPPLPRPPGSPEAVAYNEAMKLMQRNALTWLLEQNATPGSEYFRRLDPSRVVAMGYSCGGFIALENAAVDDRIQSVLVFNSSTQPGWTQAQITDLLTQIPAGTPYGIFDGGPSDIAYPNAIQTWAYLPDSLPGIFANWAGAGHGGFWSNAAKTTYQPDLAEFAINWIDFTLMSGSEASRAALLDDPCVICDNPAISIERKNWDAFVAPTGASNTGQANRPNR